MSECLHSLSDALQPSQLDVSPEFCDTRFNRWAAASAELRQMGIRRTPRAKMDCVMQCVLQLKQGLLECLGAVGGHGPLGADELFPVFVYVVLQCNPPHLASTLAYVQRFRSPMALKSEAGCYFTHLQAAVSFLQSLAQEQPIESDVADADAYPDPEESYSASESVVGGAGGACDRIDEVSRAMRGGGVTSSAAAATAAAVVMEANYEQQQQAWARSLSAIDRGPDCVAGAVDRATMPEESLSGARAALSGGQRSHSGVESEVWAASPAPTRSQWDGLGWTFSRVDLAQRRTETVDAAATRWEAKIEAWLSPLPSGSGMLGSLGSPLGTSFTEAYLAAHDQGGQTIEAEGSHGDGGVTGHEDAEINEYEPLVADSFTSAIMQGLICLHGEAHAGHADGHTDGGGSSSAQGLSAVPTLAEGPNESVERTAHDDLERLQLEARW